MVRRKKDNNNLILAIIAIALLVAAGKNFGLFAAFGGEEGYIPLTEFDTQFEGPYQTCDIVPVPEGKTHNPDAPSYLADVCCEFQHCSEYFSGSDLVTCFKWVDNGKTMTTRLTHTGLCSNNPYSGGSTISVVETGKYWNRTVFNGKGSITGGDNDLLLGDATAPGRRSTKVEAEFLVDLKGINFKINYDCTLDGDEVPRSCTGFGETLWRLQAGPSSVGHGTSGTIELVPSVLNPELSSLYINGIFVRNLTSSDFNNLGKFKVEAPTYGISNLRLYEPRYKPLFSCQRESDELLAMETFAAGTELSLFSTRYAVQSYCLDHPVIVSSTEGTATTAEPYSTWRAGGTTTVPAGQTWTVFYVMRNDGSISVTCPGDAYDVANDRCTQVSGVVQICSQGTFDPATGTCVVTPESTTVCPEGGRFDTAQNVCVYNPPIQYLCEVGTYSAQSGKCELTPETAAVCPDGTIWNPTSGFCEMFPSSQIICEAFFAYDSTLDKCVREPEEGNVCASGTFDEASGLCLASVPREFSCSEGTLQLDEQSGIYTCVYTPEVVGQCSQGTFDENLQACVFEPNDEYICLNGNLVTDDDGKQVCEINPDQFIVCLPGCGYDTAQNKCVCVEEGDVLDKPPVVVVDQETGEVKVPGVTLFDEIPTGLLVIGALGALWYFFLRKKSKLF